MQDDSSATAPATDLATDLATRRAQAEILMEEAKVLEAAGRLTDAVSKYRAAHRICPELDEDDDEENEEDDEDGERRADTFHVHRTIPQGYPYHAFDAATDLATVEGRNNVRRYLEEEGYVVLHNVLNPEEIAAGFEHFRKYIKDAADIDIDSMQEWKQNFGDRSVGIVARKGAGQCQMNWLARSRDRVKEAFRSLIFSEAELASDEEDKKMITSFDGFGFFRNPEACSDFASVTEGWFHVDGHDRKYIQGLVNWIDCLAPEDAGLVVLPRSNGRDVQDIMFPDLDGSENQDWGFVSLERDQQRAIEQLCLPHPAFRVPLPAGSLALWSSNTLHCNTGCIVRPEPRTAQLVRRLVSYVCMMRDPKSDELAATRREVFSNGRTTTHQPDLVRWVGDTVTPDLKASGSIITTVADLPPGAAELL